MPRSWPSRPTLATSTRSVIVPRPRSDDRRLDPRAELVLEGPDDLALGGVRLDRGEDGRHEVHVGIGGVAADRGERLLDGRVVAVVLHLVEPLELRLLDLGAD